ncbi:MAG: NAD(P)/FAD-dependent oxidoreductase [Xanthomonadaceae bacterium]|nr:NAD(P)/FAD-dependent oxidoreductase [Xanthomonadaceae bacterium]
MRSRPILIAGAGLAGTLLALLLARRGWNVELLEKRHDQRIKGFESGRSINLALAERGLHALRLAGLEREVLAQAVQMRGRMVHFGHGASELQPYSDNPDDAIWSVHRGRLNACLLNAAEAAGVRVHFHQRVESVDFESRMVELVNDHDRTRNRRSFDVLIGADGAGSPVRWSMSRVVDLGASTVPLGHRYKELEIPPDPDGGYQLDPHALHIWPRGGYMCIALPNVERTFTVTLFLPEHGTAEIPGFDQVHDAEAARSLFAREFADALPLIPRLSEDFVAHPAGLLATLYLERWHLDGRAVLLGDAAHAMVPFHGQGMNCAFEDCVALDRLLADASDFESAFAAFQAERQPNARAIQQMALENYQEMRDRVQDPAYRLQRQLELVLAKRHPDRFVPRYTMVTFRRVPYAVAFERGTRQRALLGALCQGKATLTEVDLAEADRLVVERLTPLAPGD